MSDKATPRPRPRAKPARMQLTTSSEVKDKIRLAASVQDLDENMVPICVVAPLVQLKSKTIAELIDADRLPPSVVIHGRRKPHRTTLLHKQAFVEWRRQFLTFSEIQAQFGLSRRRAQRTLKESPYGPLRLPFDERHYYQRRQMENLFSRRTAPASVR